MGMRKIRETKEEKRGVGGDIRIETGEIRDNTRKERTAWE